MTAFRSRRLRQLAGAAILFVLGAGGALAQTPAGPLAPGNARIWFYRVFLPDDMIGMPLVSMNRAPVGYATGGTSFYRDVPAGRYQITVDTYRTGLFEPEDVVLAPGQQVYVEIQSLPGWERYGNRSSYDRGTYAAALVSPRLAALQLPQTSFQGGY